MVQNRFVQIFHERAVIFCILLFPGDPVQDRRGVDCFRECPVHPVVDNRFSAPVCRINDARCSVCIPAVPDRPFIKPAGRIDIGFRIDAGRSGPLHNQARPFDSVPRRCTVWFEGIIRLFAVFLQLRNPVGCEMLRNPVFILLCPPDHMVNDPAGADPVLPRNVLRIAQLAETVGRCQECFYGMHVGIHAAII